MIVSKSTRLAIGLGVVLSACSDSSSSDVDAATAQAAFSELTGNVDASVTSYNESGSVTVSCAAGGEADVSGRVDVTSKPIAVDVEVSITYEACRTKGGVTLEGDVDFTQTVAAGSGTPLRVETRYSGDVVFSGKIEAQCAVDVHVLVDEAGKAVEVSGSFCGRDASELDLKITPRWRD